MPLADFQAWLEARSRVRVPLEDLLRGFAETCPEYPGGDRRTKLGEALGVLGREEVLRLPGSARANWDSVGSPPLPKFVTLLREKAQRPDFTGMAWVPELSFAVNVRQTRQLDVLARINAFLIANRGKLGITVPYRERALQIFGDEKHLDSAVAGDLLYGRLPPSRCCSSKTITHTGACFSGTPRRSAMRQSPTALATPL